MDTMSKYLLFLITYWIGTGSGGMNHPNMITLHHSGCSATECSVEGIRHDHINRGWKNIGYHYIIDADGCVIDGRKLSVKGSHVAYHNTNNIGICVLGNLNRFPMNDAQFTALQNLLQFLVYKYNIPKEGVKCHRDFKPTDCPGKYFPTIRAK